MAEPFAEHYTAFGARTGRALRDCFHAERLHTI
jgi:hypothetical protein